MAEKEYGIKFVKMDNGFRVEVTGDEDVIKAHREMAEAWREFIRKVKKAGKVHHQHVRDHCWWCDDEDANRSAEGEKRE